MRKAVLAGLLVLGLALPGYANLTPDQFKALQKSLVPVADKGIDPLNESTFGEPKNERGGMCPDGTQLTVAIYDPDPSDPEAVVYLFKKGNLWVALRVVQNGEDKLYVYGAQRWYPIEHARNQWNTPCDIPTAGR